jgi:hypothetical protein
MTNNSSSVAEMPPKGPLVVGGTLFVLGWLCPLFIPVVAASNLPTAWKAVVSAALMIGLPELLIVASIAILGHSGYRYVKERLLTALKRYGPPEIVGRARYHIGLVLFVLPLLLGFLEPYLGHFIPGLPENRVVFYVACDLIFVSSLFVLGLEFWNKLRALFVHGAKARFPETETPSEPVAALANPSPPGEDLGSRILVGPEVDPETICQVVATLEG